MVEEKYESLARTDSQHADKIKQEMADQFEVYRASGHTAHGRRWWVMVRDRGKSGTCNVG